MRKPNKALFCGVLAMCIVLAACRHNVNTSNPKVVFANDLWSAATVTDEVASGLVAANSAINNLQSTEPEYYSHAKPMLADIARKVQTADAALRKAKAGDTSTDWRAAVTAIAADVKVDDLTKFGIKNQNSQAAITVGLATLVTAIEAIQASFGSQPSASPTPTK